MLTSSVDWNRLTGKCTEQIASQVSSTEDLLLFEAMACLRLAKLENIILVTEWTYGLPDRVTSRGVLLPKT